MNHKDNSNSRWLWSHPALRRTILAALLLSTTMSVDAKASRWRSYTQSDGLPALEATAILEAPDGAMWVTTEAGVARLDRSQALATWQTIRATGPDNAFVAMARDSEDRIWAAGHGGHVQLFSTSGATLPLPNALGPAFVSSDITALAAGRSPAEMWLGAANGVYHWHRVTGIMRLDFLVANGPVLAVQAVAPDEAWVGLSDGLGHITSGGLSVSGVPGSTQSERNVTALLLTGSGELICGNRAGGMYVTSDGATFSASAFVDSTGRPPVEDIQMDSRGNIWAARGVAYRFDTGGSLRQTERWTTRVFDQENGLNGHRLHALTDAGPFRTGGSSAVSAHEMWFANELGVTVQSGFPWRNFTAADGDLGGPVCFSRFSNCDIINGIALDPSSGSIYFGAEWGLSRVSGDVWTAWSSRVTIAPPTIPVLSNNTVRAIHVDPDGTVWVASGIQSPFNGGVDYHLPGRPDTEWINLGSQKLRYLVSAMDRDERGDLWLAAFNGAWRLDTSVLPFTEIHYGTSAGMPYSSLGALATGGGFVFVGSPTGIARFSLAGDVWQLFPLTDVSGPTPTVVRSMIVQGDRLYAATDKGLLVLGLTANSLNDATILSATQGLGDRLDNDLRGVAGGGNGTVLVAASTGLYRIGADLRSVGRLTIQDGLPADTVNAVVSDGDVVWVGTAGEGAAGHRFEAPDTAILTPPPAVVVSDALPVSVLVSGLDFDTAPSFLRYEYRIDGQLWIRSDSGSVVSFTPALFGLADGAHLLEVRAVDNGLLEDPTPAQAFFELDTTSPTPVIVFPGSGAAVLGDLDIRGSAEDSRFQEYSVRIRSAASSEEESWTELVTAVAMPVRGSTLAIWDTRNVIDDRYTIQVVVEDTLGVRGTAEVDVLVDNEEPFANVTSPRLVRGDEGAVVYSVRGGAQLRIPPFAFDGESVISVERIDVPVGLSGPAYIVSADPTIDGLHKRPTLLLRPPSGAPSENRVIQRQEQGTWLPVGGTRVDEDGKSWIAASLDVLGEYGLGSAVVADPSVGGLLTDLRTEPRLFRPGSGAAGDQLAISFRLRRSAAVRVVVFGRSGRARRVIADGLELAAGEQALFWDGKDQDGDLVAPALYIVNVTAGSEGLTKVLSVGVP